MCELSFLYCYHTTQLGHLDAMYPSIRLITLKFQRDLRTSHGVYSFYCECDYEHTNTSFAGSDSRLLEGDLVMVLGALVESVSAITNATTLRLGEFVV